MALAGVLVNFLIGVAKIATKVTYGRKGFLWLTVPEDTVGHGMEGRAGGVRHCSNSVHAL